MGRPPLRSALPAGTALALGVLLGGTPARLGGQALAPKRALTLPATGACLRVPPTAADVRRNEAAARTAVARAREAALVGDRAAALAGFRQAAALDPASPRIAYDLGRAAEEGGDRPGAVAAYCRFLSLAPGSADAPDVRGRLASLGGTANGNAEATARAAFARGVGALERRQWEGAVAAFDEVLRAAPNAPEAAYDRGLAHLALGRDAAAARDLSAYVASPTAGSDRGDVLRAVETLRRPSYAPGGTFLRGVLIPGLGQIHTGRPIFGAAALTGVIAGVAAAQQVRTTFRDEQFVDNFGNPYTARVARSERPWRAAGYSAAGALWTIAALEATIHASRRTRERPTVVLRASGALLPTPTGAATGLRLGLRVGG